MDLLGFGLNGNSEIEFNELVWGGGGGGSGSGIAIYDQLWLQRQGDQMYITLCILVYDTLSPKY